MSILLVFFILSFAEITYCSSHDSHNSVRLDYPENDRIIRLPGLSEEPGFLQFSGYLPGGSPDTPNDDNVQLHYWFLEAQQYPEKAPLVLWLNGGPGCSSLEGLLEENGPFRVLPGPALEKNPHSWNKIANMLYLESPAGVGFSFTRDGKKSANDDSTAQYNYNALLHFVKKFPGFKGRDFYIAGESYAGIYIPTLTLQLVQHGSPLNLRGLFIGNPLTNFDINRNSVLYFINYHGLADDSYWENALQSCCADPCDPRCMLNQNTSWQCAKATDYLQKLVKTDINPYNIYATCYTRASGTVMQSYFDFAETTEAGTGSSESSEVFNDVKPKPILPCVDDRTINAYLNMPEVQKALHVDFALADKWTMCNRFINRIYKKIYRDTTPLFLEILRHNINVTLYSGDVDMACNYLGNLWFVDQLGLELQSPMKQWFFRDQDGTIQVGGFRKTLGSNDSKLHYVTVRGSGHMVPKDKPIQAYTLFSEFVDINAAQKHIFSVFHVVISTILVPFMLF